MRNSLFQQPRRLPVMLAIFFVATVVDVNQAQQSGRNQPSARDVVREIQRVDREQLLLRAPLPAKHDEANRVALRKKIKEDFKTLQAINNKMMAELWSTEDVDYGHTSDMIGQVRAKAVALKTNLSLPTDSNNKRPASPNAIANVSELRAALLVLDHSIMSFVNNPFFQKPDVVEMDQAMQASRDLEAVISLSSDLRKLTARLSSSSKRTP